MYCINCGENIGDTQSCCTKCFLDPSIPEDIIDFRVFSKDEFKSIDELEYPGERTSLATSLLICLIIALFFSLITIGIFLLMLILGLIYIKIQESRIERNYVKATKLNYSNIYNLSKIAAYRLNIPLPSVFIIEKDELNAYTSGFWGSHWIVVYSKILEVFLPQEILFIIGHEMGHIKREHTSWLSIISPAEKTYSLPLISNAMKIVFNNWSIKAEYSADRAGLIACKNINNATISLLKLIGNINSINIEEYLNQCNANKNPISCISELLGTHPFISNRILQLRGFVKNNPEYEA